MISFRKKHPAIRRDLLPAQSGFPFISTQVIHREEQGEKAEQAAIGVCFAGYDKRRGRDDIVFLAINAFWKSVELDLPMIPGSGVWQITVNTCAEDGEAFYRRPRPTQG